jgi:Type IX secretion system protein PorV
MNKIFVTLITLFTTFQFTKAQTTVPQTLRSNVPTPAMAGFSIYPADARHGALGEAGVATSHDQVDMFWNPSRTAFAETRFGFYSAINQPWLRSLVSDMYLTHIGAYYKFKNNKSAVSVNYTYFNQGSFQATNSSGQALGNFDSYDWALGISFAKKLSPNFSLGVGLKYLKSNLLSGLSFVYPLYGFQPASTIAADISIFHQDTISTKLINLNYGVYISNLSGRVDYGGTESNFIPTNLKIGIAPTLNIDKQNKLTLAIDANKLMIPTPTYDANEKLIQPKTAIGGILGSFGDAPDGFREELQEIIWSMGLEYWYDKKVAIRIGKFIESENKGGRNFTTFGVGVKIIKRINVDLAYMQNEEVNSPVGNLWRGNITFGIGKINK